MGFAEKKEYYNKQIDSIAELILKQMKEGASDWEMPWHKGIPQARNPLTGRYFSGNNLLILWQKCLKNNYTYNQWATFFQWRKLRAKVKKNEKGTLICIATPRRRRRNDNQLSIFEPIDPKQISKHDVYFKFKYYYVFNVDQVNDYYGNQEDLFTVKVDPEQQIKKILNNSNATIKSGGDTAYYSPYEDFIQMPELARFIDEIEYPALEKYYSTLLHELIHWTGHKERCDRNLFNTRIPPIYAFEELVAELGGAILASHFNQRVYPREDHAAYLNSWLNALDNDFTFFTEALELSRYAIFWLFKKTGVFEETLKDQLKRTVEHKRIEMWNGLVEENQLL